MQERELEIAAEYLSELAGLIEFKSKRLLPRDTSELESENPEEEASSIVKRLLEYQQIKDVSIELSERFLERQTHLDVPASYHTLEDNDKAELSLNNDIYDLIKAMSKLLTRRQQLSRSLEVRVTQNELSVDERIDQLRLFLSNQKDSFDLREIMRESYSLELQIVTFLAVLDLIRMSELVFSLGSDDNIMLKGV